jgi:hypothetical protein
VTVGNCAEANATGNLVACNDIAANRFVDRQDANFYLDPGYKSNLDTVAAKQMDITETKVFTNPDAADPDRLDDNDTMRLRDLLPRYVSQDGFKVEYDPANGINETQVLIPECPRGGAPRIMVAPMQDSFSFDLAQAIKTKDYEDYLVSMNGAGSATSKDAVTSVRCTAAECTTESGGFLSDTLVGNRKAISTMSIGSVQLHRQFNATAPSGLAAGQYWKVDFNGSASAVQASGQPVPWRALATTYCYY